MNRSTRRATAIRPPTYDSERRGCRSSGGGVIASDFVAAYGTPEQLQGLRAYVRSGEDVFDPERIVPTPAPLLAGGRFVDTPEGAELYERAAASRTLEEARELAGEHPAASMLLSNLMSARAAGRPDSPDAAEHLLIGAALWRLEYWGTSGVHEAREYDEPDGALAYTFESDWPGATRLVDELARLFPDLRITHLVVENHYESGMLRTFEAGKLVGSEAVDNDPERLASVAEGSGFPSVAETIRWHGTADAD